MFERVEEALNAVAAAVKGLVAGRFQAAGAHRRDDRLDSVGGEAFADAVGVVASVEGGELQDVVWVEALVVGFKLPAIVGLTGAQVEGERAVFVEGRRVDLGGEASARASKSLLGTGKFVTRESPGSSTRALAFLPPRNPRNPR